jgi:hypothetical protein
MFNTIPSKWENRKVLYSRIYDYPKTEAIEYQGGQQVFRNIWIFELIILHIVSPSTRKFDNIQP